LGCYCPCSHVLRTMVNSLGCMPCIIINFAGEMFYILEQRLRAQNIPKDKAERVLDDLAAITFNQTFVDEMFRPQYTYSMAAVKQVFYKIAHSSIMRLSEGSMDKLFDLMSMGFKYQLIMCRDKDELYNVTVNHMKGVRTMVRESTQTDVIDRAMVAFKKIYHKLPHREFYALRHSLLNFLQDRRIKVSLLLAEKMQEADGRIKLPAPYTRQTDPLVPGAVEFFDENGKQTDETFLRTCADSVSGPPIFLSPVGTNMYDPENRPNKGAGESAEPSSEAVPVSRLPDSSKIKPKSDAAKKSLNSLAGLIGTKAPVENFKLSLFADSKAEAHGGSLRDSVLGASSGGGAAKPRRADVEFGSSVGNKEEFAKKVLGDMYDKVKGNKEGGGGAAAAAAAEELDMLALMDEAGADD